MSIWSTLHVMFRYFAVSFYESDMLCVTCPWYYRAVAGCHSLSSVLYPNLLILFHLFETGLQLHSSPWHGPIKQKSCRSKSFGENIYYLISWGNVTNKYISIKNLLAHKAIIKFNMLSSNMKYWFGTKSISFHIITPQSWWRK